MPRPPGYERDAVISSATAVFWQRGYGATSITDLTAATGLKPGSLYAAFGSKKGLFLEVLDRYHTDFMHDVDHCVAESDTPLEAVRQLFRRTADATLGEHATRGCLAVNALLELAEHDPDIAEHLRANSDQLRARLQRVLEQAHADGELAADSEPARLAVFLLNNLWGMRVLCKSGPTRDAVDGILHGVMLALEPRRTA